MFHSRRLFLGGVLAAPFIVHQGSIMSIRTVRDWLVGYDVGGLCYAEVAPPNWRVCDGRAVIDRIRTPELFNVVDAVAERISARRHVYTVPNLLKFGPVVRNGMRLLPIIKAEHARV